MHLSNSIPTCFNDGYVFYIVLHELKPMLYRAGIADNSKPEFIAEYDNSNADLSAIMLTAMPGRVYVNLKFTSQENDDRKYYVDYYDIDRQEFVEVMKTDNKKDSEIIGWNKGSILFDDKHNMYYAFNTGAEYVINKLNTDTKTTEKFYSIINYTGNASAGFGAGKDDADYITIELFDGEYLYVYKRVNVFVTVSDFKGITVPYGTDGDKTITTQVNTNYLFALDMDGRCVNISHFKETGLRDTASRQQGTINVRNLFGDSRYIFIFTNDNGSEKIDGLELTEEKYVKLLEEEKKMFMTANSHHNVKSYYRAARFILMNKSQLESESSNWRNLGNKSAKAGDKE